jgi:anaerobic selenocysteine-containing dehydrogenase
MFDSLAGGKVKAVWIICTNPAASMPDTDLIERALRYAHLVVVQDLYHPNHTTKFADVLLPAAQWPEKDGVMTNSERSVSFFPRLLAPPGEALPDWEIGRGWDPTWAIRALSRSPNLNRSSKSISA